jgi:tripartite-type tricarboxylate transporter receptor subunit TctC
MLLIATNKVPGTTTAEFVAWAKARPEGVNMASVGIGSVGHMMAERFHLAAGFNRVHIPYRGGPSAILAVAQGESDYIFDNIGNSGMFAREGKLRFLSFTGRARQRQMADLPLLSEVGFPGFVEDVWFGVWGPAGLPRPMVEKINAESNRWLASEPILKRMADGAHTSLAGTPEDFTRYWMEDLKNWQAIVRETGIKME